MQQILAVGIGGFIGAVARHALTGMVHRKCAAWYPGSQAMYPLGTLLVNAIGCLLIGVLMALVMERQSLSDTVRLFLITGFLGSLTTFSAFGHETLEYIREGEWRWAIWNVSGNLFVGLSAVWLGHKMARTWCSQM